MSTGGAPASMFQHAARNRQITSALSPYLQRRRAHVVSSPLYETVKVPCQSNGSITLDIYRPSIPPSTYDQRSTVLIYLPRGPLMRDSALSASTASLLNRSLPFTVVQLNYRCGRNNPYPGPIHDVLAGYDWVKRHLLPQRAISRAGRSGGVGQVAVCGELIGGGLATMLAVTECQIGRPGIKAAAVNNPVLDWVDVYSDTGPKTSSGPDELSLNATEYLSNKLHLTRQQMLFTKPEHYFDPFASPLLFFRSAGQDIPRVSPSAPQDDLELLAFLNRESFHQEQLILSKISNAQSVMDVASASSEEKASRKTSARYPSLALQLRLPPFDITSGSASPLKEQASELTQRLRKSYLQQAVAADFGRKVLLDDELDQLDDEERLERKARDAEIRKKARLTQYEGLGLWDASSEGKGRVMDMVKWLKETLT